jgi:hypothetical protein
LKAPLIKAGRKNNLEDSADHADVGNDVDDDYGGDGGD